MRLGIIALVAAALLAGGGLRWLEAGGAAGHWAAAIRQEMAAVWPGGPCGSGPAPRRTAPATLTAARMSLPPPEPTVVMDGHM